MNAPQVSLIIPTYNYGHLIAQTLICLQQQSYADWEAIIVDDGSTDDTQKVVRGFLEADKRFRYFYQNNGGVSAARNHGIKYAKAEFIQFLDADDLLSADKLKLQVSHLQENPDTGLVNVNTLYFHTDKPQAFFTDLSLQNASSREKVIGKGLEVILELIEHNPIVVHGPLFRRQVLKNAGAFQEGMAYLEDWDLWLRIALDNCRFAHLDDPSAIAFVRAHPISASQNGNKIQEAEGYFRRRINQLVQHSQILTAEEQNKALKLNEKELMNTYKYLMARTSLRDISKFIDYYKQLQHPKLFFSCFLKSLNLRRKLA